MFFDWRFGSEGRFLRWFVGCRPAFILRRRWHAAAAGYDENDEWHDPYWDPPENIYHPPEWHCHEEGEITTTGSGGSLLFTAPSGEVEIHVATGAHIMIGNANSSTLVAGEDDIIKTGEGSLRFRSQNNPLSGRLILREGSFQVQQDNMIGVVPNVFTPDAIILDGGTMDWVNTGGQPASENSGYTVTSNGGTLHKGASANVNLGAVISGAGPLRRTGMNQFTFLADNTFSGPFIVQSDEQTHLTTFAGSNNLSEGINLEIGTLRLNAQGASGTGLISVSPGATLRTSMSVEPEQDQDDIEVILVPKDIDLPREG
jgi:hypothetical protein